WPSGRRLRGSIESQHRNQHKTHCNQSLHVVSSFIAREYFTAENSPQRRRERREPEFVLIQVSPRSLRPPHLCGESSFIVAFFRHPAAWRSIHSGRRPDTPWGWHGSQDDGRVHPNLNSKAYSQDCTACAVQRRLLQKPLSTCRTL